MKKEYIVFLGAIVGGFIAAIIASIILALFFIKLTNPMEYDLTQILFMFCVLAGTIGGGLIVDKITTKISLVRGGKK